jgi:hypothetical protein
MKRVPVRFLIASAVVIVLALGLGVSLLGPTLNLAPRSDPVASPNPASTKADQPSHGSAPTNASGSASGAAQPGADVDALARINLTAVPLIEGTGGNGLATSGRGNPGQLLDKMPEYDAATLALQKESENEAQQQPDPLTPVDRNPARKASQPETSSAQPPQPAGVLTDTRAPASKAPAADFYYYQLTSLATNASLIGEASHATAGMNTFETWNWGVAMSLNGGVSYKYLNPYSLFPASYGGFCCDQVVYYDQSHDILFWILQYNPDGSGNNAIRVAWANGKANIASANFCYTDFTPQNHNPPAPSGTNYDQPKFARSDNNIYLEMTQYGAGSGSVVIRVPVSSFTSACSGVTYQWYAPGLFSPGFTQRAYGTMYFAAHVSNSTLRVFAWPESAPTYTGITTHDVSHTAYPANFPYTCPRTGGSATSDWCQRRSFGGGWAHSDRIFTGWLAGGVIAFAWDASQGTNGSGGFNFPYPYVHITRINEGAFTLVNEPVQWSNLFAIQYATAALDDRFHVAGTVMWGGGTFYQNCANFIADDLSPGYTGIGYFPAGAWEWYAAVNSNIDPTDKLSGDYFATRRNDLNPNSWSGSCYALQNNGSGGVAVHPYYSWFGRLRDYTTIHQVAFPILRR